MMLTALCLALRQAYGGFDPRSLFAGGEQGAWYDPSDLTTLFQDSAGTTPVTAVEQPVGLMLDKSGRNNHAFQTVSANRPVLSARVNLLTETEFRNGLTDAPVRGGVVSAASLGAYLGAIAFGYQSGVASYAYKTFAQTSGTAYKIAVVVRMDDGGVPNFVSADGMGGDGVLVAGGNSGLGSPSVADIGGGYYRVSVGYTAISSGTSNFGVVKYASQSSRTFKVTAYDLRVTNTGVNLPAYQRVNTSTDYDTTGFPLYLRFNGTSSYLDTANTAPLVSQPSTIFAGFRVNGSTRTQIVFGGQAAGAEQIVFFDNSGVMTAYAGHNAYSNQQLDKTYITTHLFNGVSSIQRINSIQNTVDLGVQSLGKLRIGAYYNSDFFMNGNLYGLIVRGAQSSATEISTAEAWMNSKTKAY